MRRINKLDSSIFNRIAAGEVVERPKSVVKELLENSIDAGATSIEIEIKDGGKSLIKISDNGAGILSADVRTAFLPHATSKIKNITDLDMISTLGFRGEALPSIASVGKVELITRSVEEELGSRIYIEGGEIISEQSADFARGTTITVSDLFFNTPARAKFLKKNKSEEAEITSTVCGLILANPDIAFKYTADGKVVYQSAGRGLEDAVYSVYTRDVTVNLLPLNAEYDGYKIRGYIGKPQFTKPTRGYQTIVINGRLINNLSISAAVQQAYETSLMKRSFPVFILDIIMPFDSVDVNVTPNKSDVRFADGRKVFGMIYHSVRSALQASQAVFTLNSGYESERNEQLRVSDNQKNDARDGIANGSLLAEKKETVAENLKSATLSAETVSKPDYDYGKARKAIEEKRAEISVDNKKTDCSAAIAKQFSDSSDNVSSLVKQSGAGNKSFAGQSDVQSAIDRISKMKAHSAGGSFPKDNSTLKESASPVSLRSARDIEEIKAYPHEQLSLFEKAEDILEDKSRVIGQIFNTYLLVSKGQYLYIIDQHAAHERLLYDELSAQVEKGDVLTQPLLIPQIVELSVVDSDYLSSILEELREIGLEIDEFGTNTFKISSIPVLLQAFNLKNYIDEILKSRSAFAKIKIKTLLKDKLAVTACKAAVKGGDALNDFQIDKLLGMMKDNLPLQCPHGRPAIIRVERKDIDKIFKRIL